MLGQRTRTRSAPSCGAQGRLSPDETVTMVMTITAVCKGFTLARLHLSSQAISKLDWPCALPLLSSSHVYSSFQNMNFLEGFWVTRMLGHSLALSHEEWLSSCWGCLFFQLSFLAYFVSLFVPQEELSICLLAEMSFLTTAMSAWGI